MTQQLNRRVELQRATIQRDSYGGEVKTWATLATVWARVEVTGVSENFDNDANRAVPIRNAKMEIRYRRDLRETDRVVYDGLAWDIEGLGELGYRRGTLLYCQTDASRRLP